MLIIQPQEGVCGAIATEEVEMEILMEEEVEDDEDEFSSEEEEEEEAGRPEEVTSPKIPVETKRESTGSLGFSKELSSILASKMNTLNDGAENISGGDETTTKKEETNTKETGKFQQRRKPPPPPVKPKVWM